MEWGLQSRSAAFGYQAEEIQCGERDNCSLYM